MKRRRKLILKTANSVLDLARVANLLFVSGVPSTRRHENRILSIMFNSICNNPKTIV